LGARILTAVDVLDALASDRQYRKAMPLDEAIAILKRDSGKMFDPRVVNVLALRYVELERMAREKILTSRPVIQTDVRVERGAAPDAGFESGSGNTGRFDLRGLHLAVTGGNSLQLEACGSFARRANVAIAYDALGVFVEIGETLYNIYSDGAAGSAIQGLEIPLGEGLVGWVAKNHQPIINGNPAVERGLMSRPQGSLLSSAMAVPVESSGKTGLLVVCLYRYERDGFNRDQLKMLQSLSADFLDRVPQPIPY
jgi:hypothetical protein